MTPKVSEEYKKKRKQELVEVAREVFVQKGFIRTTMQDIMDRAGISRGALYSYFNNIEHVFLEVLKYDDQKDIQNFMPSGEGSNWLQIRQWIEEQRTYIERIEQTLLLAKAEFFLSSNYANDKEHFPYISERYIRLIEVIENVINVGENRGEFNPQQPSHTIARYIISFLNGLMLDTFQFGYEQTKVKEQLSILLFTLEKLLNPTSLNEE
ncbi:TetR family transcriptional regulator [Caldibacillus thermolactis]|jgi:AcrR family transcriptional regulator|uniref:TetR family transcriptional regulator n=1 Tax=Pallidibacillus thermolactis TaxID=251051 RepID=A0ABT2WD00_9BACI|nr:TetR family transcriptional regulator [Pallidibacillus thermolactis]MCU9593559.1 TetR family transcriptional regulator [Pallidibacillus thermolactis]MCU9600451.1 TetR family transcriptional regulator [Pallidibacillus thermolactis subsp. kokeshiiformis]MED1674484.1 TetR family transcriptional regulator [Pallidibacillus thermolactis subsp. kokeshiiformis]